MSDEHYKLTYFNIRGRAEVSRYILHYAGVDFEDCRIERENWPQYKDAMPTKQLPVLEIRKDGKTDVMTQSTAITRYLARKYNLAGADGKEATLCDEVVDTIVDVGSIAGLAYHEADPARKEQLHQMLKTQLFPTKLGYLEKKLKENGGCHIVGKQWTFADFTISCLMNLVQDNAGPASGELAAHFPLLTALAKSVEAIPQIAAYIAKRPVTAR